MIKVRCRDCGIITDKFILVYERIGELVPLCDRCYYTEEYQKKETKY